MPPHTTYLRERKRLAARLKDLRKAADVSGNALAKRLGWAQSKVSRIENAKQLPSDDDIRAWAQTVGASSQTLGELLGVRRAAAVAYATHEADFRALGGAAAKQRDVAEIEAAATRIGEFQPAMIPGLLQTAEYAAHVLRLPCGPAAWGADAPDIEATIAARMQRQRVLYAPGKRIEMVVMEAALLSRIVPAGVLAGQLDRLLAVLGLPTLTLGVIPFTSDIPVFPLGGFAIFDTALVVLESVAGEQPLTEARPLAVYDQALAQLLDVAAKGEQAAAIIGRALTALRTNPNS